MPTVQRFRRELYDRLGAVETNQAVAAEKQAASDSRLEDISKDVKSLLTSRTFSRGILKTAMILAGFVSAIFSAVIVYITQRLHP